MPLTFPTHLFNPASIKVRLTGGIISGGESLSGVEDPIATGGGGFWVIAMSGIELLTPDQIRMWRAWEAHLENGATDVLVPIADVRQAPRPSAGGRPARPSQLLATSDDPYFPEAVGFATPFIVAETVGAALLRATELTIDVTRGAPSLGGEHFAVDHATKGRRLHKVGRVMSRDGQRATARISPPLREALTNGAAIDFDWPSVVCRLVPGQDISPDIQNGRSASVSIMFREAP